LTVLLVKTSALGNYKYYYKRMQYEIILLLYSMNVYFINVFRETKVRILTQTPVSLTENMRLLEFIKF